MSGWLLVLFWWATFAGIHLVLSSIPVRRPLIARLGAGAFQALYSLLVGVSLVLLVRAYWASRHAGPLIWEWAALPGMRTVAIALSAAGLALFVASLFPSRSSDRAPGEPRRARGLTRVTRHPGFVGLGLWGLAHALVNGHLSDLIFFGGFPLFGIVGGLHQDARKRATEGESLRAFYRETSFLPFAAIAAGRNRLIVAEIPWSGVAIGFGVVATLYVFHARLFG